MAGDITGGGVVMVLVGGGALGSNCTGAVLLVEGEFVAVGTVGGGGGKEGKASLTSPARTALTVSATLPGAMNRVAIANVAQLSGRISPFTAVPTTAKTVLSTQKLSNPSTIHLSCNMTLL
jgi:hypothetical protein